MKNATFSQLLSKALVAATAVLSGCTTVNTVERAQPVAQRGMLPDKRILTDAALNRHARVLSVNQSTGPGGLMRVQAELLNTTRSVQTFSYRWEWFDETGIMIDTPTSTTVTRQVEGKETLFITGVAPNERAKDFRLKIIGDLR